MDALEAIARRYGVLRFRPDPVEPAKIEAVLRAAVAAPSPVNLQPWTFVVVTDPVMTRQTARYLVEVQEVSVFTELLDLPESYTARLMDMCEALTGCLASSLSVRNLKRHPPFAAAVAALRERLSPG